MAIKEKVKWVYDAEILDGMIIKDHLLLLLTYSSSFELLCSTCLIRSINDLFIGNY